MRIVTISRQFGSGGRELGKRLADVLGWDYYDKEIIEKLAEEKGMDPDYVGHVLSNHEWQTIPIRYRSSFSNIAVNSAVKTELLTRQREIIEEIAAAGNDCIIVGRDADVILRDHRPFRIFVVADMPSRLARCMRFEMKKPENERLSEKQVLKNIKRIDNNRARTREVLTGKAWGDASSFDLTVNAAGWEIKLLAPAIGELIIKWFEQCHD